MRCLSICPYFLQAASVCDATQVGSTEVDTLTHPRKGAVWSLEYGPHPAAERSGVGLRKTLGELLPQRRATGQSPGAQLFLGINSWPQIQVGMMNVGGEDRASPDLLLISRGKGWTQGNNMRTHVCTHTHTQIASIIWMKQQTQPGNRGLRVNFKVWDTGHQPHPKSSCPPSCLGPPPPLSPTREQNQSEMGEARSRGARFLEAGTQNGCGEQSLATFLLLSVAGSLQAVLTQRAQRGALALSPVNR
ncbi:unnamed protein product [Rangifer tarandus platyrhynchus]|uniref:Uncharacterized protein n=1 Tax=Rangifer tarandus platyrhynchus TaxID=3082113 RepID=A0AC59Z799_RANTA